MWWTRQILLLNSLLRTDAFHCHQRRKLLYSTIKVKSYTFIAQPLTAQKRITFGPVKFIHNSKDKMPRIEQDGILDLYRLPTRTETLTAWRNADAVCFDVDSTVIVDEGLDKLANFCGKGEVVEKITQEAMRGGLEFREALRVRLDYLSPTMDDVQNFIRVHPPILTPGIKKLVDELHRRGVDVYLVSGGFSSLISPVARKLNIPLENMFANRLKFYFDGSYAGFDESQLTSRSGGKGEVIAQIQKRRGYGCVVMVGDGATDMEACPPAQAFIGFGGNVVRDSVKKEAPYFVTDFDTLIQELDEADIDDFDQSSDASDSS